MLLVESIDSIEGLLAEERKAGEAADARVQDWQRQIKIGDCFRQITADGLEIFGEVVGQGWGENWRRCRCYSFACPEGEAGFVHVLQMETLIDRKTFEAVGSKLRKAYRLALKQLKQEGFSFDK